MTRILKEPSVRRGEIFTAAQRLIYSRGYEQMTIQDILDETQLSKGAFYHYFDSKQALLQALIEHTGEQGLQLIRPILNDPGLNALQKFQSYFDAALRWKTAQKSMMIALLQSWYSDENAIVRQKELAAGKKRMTPLLIAVVQQGVAEGLLATQTPEQTVSVLITLILGLSDALGESILAGQAGRADLTQVEAIVATYTDAIERVLGAAPASLKLIDSDTLKTWFI